MKGKTDMKNREAQFITKTSVKALLNSPLVAKKAVIDNASIAAWQNAEICRKTTELAGAFPYLFTIASRACENLPGLVKDGGNFYYTLGTEDNPIPWDVFVKCAIGTYKDQKHLFLVELKRLMSENRFYFLPTGKNNLTYAQPFRITLITSDLQKIDMAMMKRLKNMELTNYVLSGVILDCYKPLFKGHFNGHKDGFIKQPAAWYAKIRNGVNGMIEADAEFRGIVEAHANHDMTALNVLKIWEYLALHDNGQGKTKNVDVVDMLSHVALSYLNEGKYLRTECLGGLFNALITLAKLTHEYRNELDFVIRSIELDRFDQTYALNHGHRQGTAPFMVSAMKHRLKAHDNVLTLHIERKKRRDHAGK
jgi:hypothetical protein